MLVRKITSARLPQISHGFHNFSWQLGMLHHIISVICAYYPSYRVNISEVSLKSALALVFCKDTGGYGIFWWKEEMGGTAFLFARAVP